MSCICMQATFSQLCHFVVQHQADADLLANKFLELKMRSNVITIVDDISHPLVSQAASLQKYGVVCSLDEVSHSALLPR